MPLDALRALAGPPAPEDEQIEAAVWGAMPDEARNAWVQGPHRMYTTEAQVRVQTSHFSLCFLLHFVY